MEKMRYYCELPGDMWEDGTFMKLIKRNQYHHTSKGRVKYEWLLREHQVTTELVVIDPNDSYLFLNDQLGQIIPIIGKDNPCTQRNKKLTFVHYWSSQRILEVCTGSGY